VGSGLGAFHCMLLSVITMGPELQTGDGFSSEKPMNLVVESDQEGTRLDTFLASRIQELSRSRVQQLIKQQQIKVNQVDCRPSYRVKAGDRIFLRIPAPEESFELVPEQVPFDVIYEDESLVVVNKPPGVVVHPAPGHHRATLVHGLLHRCKDLQGIGGQLRPGIVHRLDKDTSGLMVVAKSEVAFRGLAAQFKEGTVKKEYHALVHGVPRALCGEIEVPIGRHGKKRKEMAVDTQKGRYAFTGWKKIEEYYKWFSLLAVRIRTGRTHQIRVHLSYIGHPVVGDPVYGYGKNWWKGKRFSPQGKTFSPVARQMLHARVLGFIHPITNKEVTFEVAYPDDMARLLRQLRGLERA